MSPPYDEGRPRREGAPFVEKRQQLNRHSVARKRTPAERLTRRDWRQLVQSHPRLTRHQRSTALDLAGLMRTDGTLCALRPTIARELHTSESGVDRLLRLLVGQGLLSRALRGHTGQRPEYHAVRGERVRSDAQSVGESASLADAQSTAESASEVTHLSIEKGERSERVAVDRSAADEPTTTEPAPAVTRTDSPNSSNEKGSSHLLPLAAPVPIRSTHVCRQGCHGFDFLTSLYAREAA